MSATRGRGRCGPLAGLELGVRFGGRPLEAWLDLAPPGQSRTELPYGAQSVLPHAKVYGFPTEVMRAALDPATVAAMRESAAALRVEALTTDGDWLGTLLRVHGELPDAVAVSGTLELVRGAADRLTEAFDHAHAEALRAGGPAAGAQWLAAQRAEAQLRGEQRQRGRVFAIGVAVLVMFLIVSIILALVVFLGG